MSQRTCEIDNCQGKHVARGMCMSHYNRWKEDQRQASGIVCSAGGCGLPMKSGGWCQAHYVQARKYGGKPLTRPLFNRLPADSAWCPQCQQVKPKSAFGLSLGRARGVTTFCTSCLSELRATRWREGTAVYQRKWRARNPAKVREYERRTNAKNPRRRLDAQARRKAADPERFLAWARAGDANRRAREKSASGRSTTAQVKARWDYYGGLCWMCGADAVEIDHVKPLAKGGSHWPSNLRPACRDCNSRKRARWPYPLEVAHARHFPALAAAG